MSSTTDTRTAHEAALAILVPPEKRAAHDLRVAALVIRNQLLTAIDDERDAQHLSNKDLAERVGLDQASVWRILTSESANPTSANVLLLLSSLGMHLEVVHPSGERRALVA